MLSAPLIPDTTPKTIRWTIAQAPVPYEEALARMDAVVCGILSGEPEEVWLLEHPSIYTAGTSAKDTDLLEARFPVHRSGRGGQFTYHGPGQRVGYVMVDLKQRGNDIRKYVRDLEEWIIRTLDSFGLKGERRAGRVGIWIARGKTKEDKIAAIGVRVRQGVAFHGISLNVMPDLSHYAGIVPCGVTEHGVTSLTDLGITTTMDQVDKALKESFATVFEKV